MSSIRLQAAGHLPDPPSHCLRLPGHLDSTAGLEEAEDVHPDESGDSYVGHPQPGGYEHEVQGLQMCFVRQK